MQPRGKGRKMITAHNGTLIDQDPDRGHRCVDTPANAAETPKRATPKRAAAAAALRTLEASHSDDDVVDESDLPEDSIWRLDDSPVKSRSSSSASRHSTPQSAKQQKPAAQQKTPVAQQTQAKPVQPPIRMVWAPPQKVFGRANYKDPANTVLMYESRRWPGQILILCREGPNMSGRQRFKCRRCTSTPEGKRRGHPPVIVQDGEIINQDPDELYQPEGHICMMEASGGTSTSTSKPASAQSTGSTPAQKTQEGRGETPVVVNPCPRPGRPATSMMSREPPKVIAPAKFEDASEEILIYESRRFCGKVFRFAKKTGGPTGKRFYTCVDCDPLSATKRKPVRVAIVLDGNIVGNDPDNLYDDVGHLCQADASKPYLTLAPPQARAVTPSASKPASDTPTTSKQSVAREPVGPVARKIQASPERSSDHDLTPARKRGGIGRLCGWATRAWSADAKTHTETKTPRTKKPVKTQASPESPPDPVRTPEASRKRAVCSDGPARRTRASDAKMPAEAEPISAAVPTTQGTRKQASRGSSRARSVGSVSSGNGTF
ncbi:hypothetical protein AAVH_06375 [Aphelenchoides avenae]|nr:hypothetical protein AAVH_06375 [Aphelenchus avenae]